MMETLQPYIDLAVDNADILGTIAISYLAIQALKRFLPKDARPFASVVVCAALTAVNPLREWDMALSLMYGGLMGVAQIGIHNLGGPLLRWALKRWLGEKEGAREWRAIQDKALSEARAAYESTKDIKPPTTMEAAAKKLHDTLT